MPTLCQPIGRGIVVADYRFGKAVLFDTTRPRWWVVDADDIQRADVDSNASNSFLDHLLSSGWPEPASTTDPQQFYVVYKLTNKCNFTCSYCYDRDFTRKRDSKSRNRTVRDYLSRLAADFPGAIVNILFHGGEPLLEFGEITDLVRYAESICNLTISFSIQTNASLLDQEKYDFIKNSQIGLSISVDGVDRKANALRTNSYDSDCYSLVLKKIREIRGLSASQIGLLMTIGAHNVASITEAISHAEKDGFRSISFSFMHKIDQHTVPATTIQIIELYVDLIDRIVNGTISKIAIWPLIELVQMAVFGRGTSICNSSPCGAGRNLISILPSGELSPCDSLFSADFIFRDFASYETARESSPHFRNLLRRNISTLAECGACDVRQYCNGTCPGNALLSKKSTDAVDISECELHYLLIREIVWRLADVRVSPILFDYARDHLKARRHQTRQVT